MAKPFTHPKRTESILRFLHYKYAFKNHYEMPMSCETRGVLPFDSTSQKHIQSLVNCSPETGSRMYVTSNKGTASDVTNFEMSVISVIKTFEDTPDVLNGANTLIQAMGPLESGKHIPFYRYQHPPGNNVYMTLVFIQ